MYTDRKDRPETVVSLKEDTVCYGGMVLFYRLLANTKEQDEKFWIEVAKIPEVHLCGVGNDLLVALDCYRKIVDGAVTPCTLEEVVDDLHDFH